MNRKYVDRSRMRRVDRQQLSAGPAPIDWAAVINGTARPAMDFNFMIDDSTAQTIYIATGVLSASILIAAWVRG